MAAPKRRQSQKVIRVGDRVLDASGFYGTVTKINHHMGQTTYYVRLDPELIIRTAVDLEPEDDLI